LIQVSICLKPNLHWLFVWNCLRASSNF
jgi:hypothetical protein